MSNHDRSNHDRRIMSENPGVYIAIKSAVRVPHSSFRLVKFFKNLNIPSQWNGIIINKLSKGMRRILTSVTLFEGIRPKNHIKTTGRKKSYASLSRIFKSVL